MYMVGGMYRVLTVTILVVGMYLVGWYGTRVVTQYHTNTHTRMVRNGINP